MALAGPGDGRERLRQGLINYLAFAERRPGLHALMFESDFLRRKPPPRVMIGPADRAYEVLWEALQGAFPGADPLWVRKRTVTMLSTVVGYRVLDNVDRFKPHMVDPLTSADLLDAVLEAAIGEGPALKLINLQRADSDACGAGRGCLPVTFLPQARLHKPKLRSSCTDRTAPDGRKLSPSGGLPSGAQRRGRIGPCSKGHGLLVFVQ